LFAFDGSLEPNVWKPARGADPCGCAGLIDPRDGGDERWAGIDGQGFKTVEFGIMKGLPPVAARFGIAGRGGLPAPLCGGDLDAVSGFL
jgi:hypothetical protein